MGDEMKRRKKMFDSKCETSQLIISKKIILIGFFAQVAQW